MKIKRSMLAFAMTVVLSFMLAACGSTPGGSPAASEIASGDNSTSPSAESDNTSESNNILIAYFSHTGNTEEAAQKIAEYTDGDLAEIQRAEEYENLNEEAEAEILDGIHPDITVSVENIADYDTVFVGYPKLEQGFTRV